MIARLLKRAEHEISREEAEERKRKVETRAKALADAEQARSILRSGTESRQRSVDALREEQRQELIATFGKIGSEIDPLAGYHCLSCDGQRFHLLFDSRNRLMEARKVAVEAGIHVDDWHDHANLTGRQVGQRLHRVVAVNPTDSQVRKLRKLT